ncbi:MAG: hypothetical protein JJU46_04865 [Balneolaceae bacterium]|nr:hypothetical protein [Balneolaceae bacterium]
MFAHEAYPTVSTELVTELNTDPDADGFGQPIFLELLPDGDFHINDIQATTLFHYDSNGELKSAFSSEGRGPGEFLMKMVKSDPDSDRVGFYDPMLSRVTLMDSGLDSVIVTFPIDQNQEVPLELLGLQAESVYMKGNVSYTLQNYDEEKFLKIFIHDYESEELELLRKLPATEYHATVDHDAGSIHLNYMPLGKRAGLTMQGDHFIYISSNGYGYTKIDQSGDTVYRDSIPSDQLKPYTLTESQYEEHVRELAGSSLPEHVRSDIIQELRSVSDRETAVWFNNSFVDLNGRLWFELPPMIFEDETRWLVWDRDEADLFQIKFDDAGVTPQNALDNKVIAFRLNEYDMQTVQIYSISL